MVFERQRDLSWKTWNIAKGLENDKNIMGLWTKERKYQWKRKWIEFYTHTQTKACKGLGNYQDNRSFRIARLANHDCDKIHNLISSLTKNKNEFIYLSTSFRWYVMMKIHKEPFCILSFSIREVGNSVCSPNATNINFLKLAHLKWNERQWHSLTLFFSLKL